MPRSSDCFRSCIGKRVVGFLFDSVPHGQNDLAAETQTIIFDDGTGLTFAPTLGCWMVESVKDVEKAIDNQLTKLRQLKQDIAMAIGPQYASETLHATAGGAVSSPLWNSAAS